MRKTLYLWIGILALSAGMACKKNSSTAAGSESCLINGKPWVASAAAEPVNAPVGFTYGDTVFTVNGQDTGSIWSFISIRVDADSPGFAVGVPIPLNGFNEPAFLSYFTDSSCYGVGGVNTVNALAISGTVTITKLDTVHHEIAGTFSAVVPMPPCDTIQITDGRFDQYYIEL